MKILLGTDGSPAALYAVRHALALRAQGLEASFVLANVQAPASLYEVVTAHDPEVIRQVRSGAGADLLAPAEALLQRAGAEFESEVAGGDAGHVLRELAERHGCDAIVLGATEGIGSVAQDVLAHCPLPVTLVRLPEE
jgi:nucleotide-binding universal stress UspA family protein